MLDGWASRLALGYIAAGPAVNDAARLTAIARLRRAEAALQDANDDRQRLCDEYNQLAAYATALIAENAALRQESAGLRQHAADLKAWGESLRDRLAEAQRIVEYNALYGDVRKDLTRMLCG